MSGCHFIRPTGHKGRRQSVMAMLGIQQCPPYLSYCLCLGTSIIPCLIKAPFNDINYPGRCCVAFPGTSRSWKLLTEMVVGSLSFDVLGYMLNRICEAVDPQGKHHTIILLSSICSAWRYTALACPELWSYIYLPMLSGAESSRSTEARQNLLVLYIERSRTRPLSITIRNNSFVFDFKYSRQLPFTPRMYTLLSTNAYRWRRLDIVGCHAQPHNMRHLLCSLFCHEMGMLKSLKLMHSNYASALPALLEWNNATALHTLHIHMYTVLPTQCSRRVKDLILKGCTGSDRPAVDGGMSCILPFSNIERLVLIPMATIKTRATIKVANLTSLTLCITIHSLTSFGSYLHGLYLPSLRSFALLYSGTYIGNAVDHKPIVSFVCGCPEALQELILDGLPLRPLGLAEILALSRELRHLTVHEPKISLLSAYYPISEAFLLNFHDAHFLPSLASVDLQLHSASTVEQAMIDRIVKERMLRTLDAGEAFSLRTRAIPYLDQEAVPASAFSRELNSSTNNSIETINDLVPRIKPNSYGVKRTHDQDDDNDDDEEIINGNGEDWRAIFSDL